MDGKVGGALGARLGRGSAVLVLGAAVLGCPSRPKMDEAAALEKGRAAVAEYKGALKGELTQAMAKGPEAAIEVCASRAPAIAAERSKAGVRLGRSAIKLRSRADAPAGWLAPVMGELASGPRGANEGRAVALGDGRWGYVEPIWIQPPCLACHGETIAPNVDAKLRARYPDDDARGFRDGDFRGVFFAEIAP